MPGTASIRLPLTFSSCLCNRVHCWSKASTIHRWPWQALHARQLQHRNAALSASSSTHHGSVHTHMRAFGSRQRTCRLNCSTTIRCTGSAHLPETFLIFGRPSEEAVSKCCSCVRRSGALVRGAHIAARHKVAQRHLWRCFNAWDLPKRPAIPSQQAVLTCAELY